MRQERTLQELKDQHRAAVDSNRRRPVRDYSGGKASTVLEVAEGKHHAPAVARGSKAADLVRGETLVPGDRFIPTLDQLESLNKKGGLDAGEGGKFRVVEGAAAASISRTSRKPMSTGADIGLRALPTLKGEALKAALDAGLQVEDFDEVEPVGKFGRFTPEQVADVIRAKGGS